MTDTRKTQAFETSQLYVRCLNELHKVKALKQLDPDMHRAIMAMVHYTVGDLPKDKALEVVNGCN